MSDYVQERLVEAMKADLMRKGMTEDEALDAILRANAPRHASTLGRIFALVIGTALVGFGVVVLWMGYVGAKAIYLGAALPVALGAIFLIGAAAGMPLGDIARLAFPRNRRRGTLNFPEPPSPTGPFVREL